jgi:hypothetical protein
VESCIFKCCLLKNLFAVCVTDGNVLCSIFKDLLNLVLLLQESQWVVIRILVYELITVISIAQYCRPVYINIIRSQSKLQILLRLCELKPRRTSSFQILYLAEALNMHVDPLNKFRLIGIRV